jgi:hypothetical protein
MRLLRKLSFGFGFCAIAVASIAEARIRCGGCSDPCGRGAQVVGCNSSCGIGGGYRHGGFNGYNAGPVYNNMAGMPGDGNGGMGNGGMNGGMGNGGCALDGSYAAQSSFNNDLPKTVDALQVILEPQFVTEKRLVPTTEYKDEVAYRTRTIYRTVPVSVEDFRVTTVMVPKTEVKVIEYSVLVSDVSQKTVDTVESVPEWKEIEEKFTVKVPQLIDQPEEYTVRVASLRDEPFKYTVYVPHNEIVQRLQTVSTAAPVTKVRMVNRPVQVAKTKTVCKDYGHWETVVEDASAGLGGGYPNGGMGGNGIGNGNGNGNGCGCGSGSPCGHQAGAGSCGSSRSGACRSCGGCGKIIRSMIGRNGRACNSASTCGSCGGCGQSSGIAGNGMTIADSQGGLGAGMGGGPTSSRQVWVPNMVNEEVQVVETELVCEEISYTVFEQQSQQIPVDVNCLVLRPEVRDGIKKVVDYTPEVRTRTRKAVKYVDEERSRVRRELVYKQETKPITYPVVNYRTEKKTKEVSFTYNVPETRTEPFTSTRYDQVPEDVVEQYAVKVPVTVMKEVDVQVCRMVPKVVPVRINVECLPGMVPGYGGGNGSGAGNGAGNGYGPGNGGSCGCANGSAGSAGACNGGCGRGHRCAVMNVVASPCGCR